MAYTEFYCNPSTGDNLYAGSTTGAPLVTYASGTWVQATRVFTVASGDPVADGVAVGDYASVYPDGTTGGTVFIGRITARTTTTITISATAQDGAAPANGTANRTLVVGGVWKGPNAAVGFPLGFLTGASVNVSGDPVRCNLKNNATYSITAAMTHNIGSTTIQGYTTTPGDGGKATIDGGTVGASYVLLTNTTGPSHYCDLIFANNGATGSAALVTLSIACIMRRCVFHDSRGAGVITNSGPVFVECEAYACNTSNTASLGGFVMSAVAGAMFLRCVSHNNTGSNAHGFVILSNNSANRPALVACVADTNGGSGYLMNQGANAIHFMLNCTAYGNTGDGVRFANAQHGGYLENCLFAANTGSGINYNSTPTQFPQLQQSCGFHGNGAEATNVNASFKFNDVSFAAAPMSDPANGNFAPTSAQALGSGRGAFTQTSGYTGSSLSAPDIGAVQIAGGSASAVFSSPFGLGRRDYRKQVTRRTYQMVPGSIQTANVYVPVRIDNPRARGQGKTVNRTAPPRLVPLPAVINNIYIPVPYPKQVRQSVTPSRPAQVRAFPVIVVQTTALPLPPQVRQVTRVVRQLRREPVVVITPPPQTVIVTNPKVVR